MTLRRYNRNKTEGKAVHSFTLLLSVYPNIPASIRKETDGSGTNGNVISPG